MDRTTTPAVPHTEPATASHHEIPQPSTSSGITHPPAPRIPNYRTGEKRKAEKQLTSMVEKTRRIADPNDTIRTGFNNRQLFIGWDYQGDADILTCLNNIKAKIRRYITWYYHTLGQHKYYFCIRVKFEKQTENEVEYIEYELNSTAVRLLMLEEFDDIYI